MKNYIFVAILVSAMAIGCAKIPEAIDLARKSPADVLQIKYEKAVLNCYLWSEKSPELLPTDDPADSFSLDLKRQLNLPQTFILKGDIPDHQVELDIRVNSVENGVAHQSLYVSVTVKHHSISNAGRGYEGPGTSDGGGTLMIDERAKENVLDSRMEFDNISDSGKLDILEFHDYAECSVVTQIKKEYQRQKL